MKKRTLLSFLALSFVLFFSTKVIAQEGKIHVGKMKILPGITVKTMHDDNIYSDFENEVPDWITHVKPGLGLSYDFPQRGSLKIGYRGDFALYSVNTDNNWNDQMGYLLLDYKSPGGLILAIDNTYTDAEDPYGSENQYKLGVPNTKRWHNDLKGKIGYKFTNRFETLAYYNFYKQSYELEVDKTQDYKKNEYGVGVQMKVLPKTWVFIRYHNGVQDYYSHPAGSGVTDTNDASFKFNRVNVGLAWDTRAKLNGELNFGYEWRDNENTTDVNDLPYDNKNSWIASTAIFYDATSKTRLFLNISRCIRPSGANTSEYFEDTVMRLGFRQKFLTDFTLSVSGLYGTNDYNLPEDNKRKQQNYKANIGFDYQIQDWLSTGIEYTYSDKDSNNPEDEFTVNQFAIKISAVY